MILNWKTFKIDLSKFNNFLDTNLNSYVDGIVANSDNFEIIELSPLQEEQIQIIMNYYNSLEENNG